MTRAPSVTTGLGTERAARQEVAGSWRRQGEGGVETRAPRGQAASGSMENAIPTSRQRHLWVVEEIAILDGEACRGSSIWRKSQVSIKLEKKKPFGRRVQGNWKLRLPEWVLQGTMGTILPQRKPKIGDRGDPRKADTVDVRHGQSTVDRRCQVILERRHPKPGEFVPKTPCGKNNRYPWRMGSPNSL